VLRERLNEAGELVVVHEHSFVPMGSPNSALPAQLTPLAGCGSATAARRGARVISSAAVALNEAVPVETRE